MSPKQVLINQKNTFISLTLVVLISGSVWTFSQAYSEFQALKTEIRLMSKRMNSIMCNCCEDDQLKKIQQSLINDSSLSLRSNDEEDM